MPQVRRRTRARSQHFRSMASAATLALLGLALAGSTEAGTIHPGLAARLDLLNPNEKVGAILVLTEQAPIPALSTSLSMRRATRQERHREVVLTLQETAARTQGPILDRLQQLESEGRVAGYTPYWIANLIVVEGDRSAIVELAARADVAQAEVNFEIALISPIATPDEGSSGGGQGEVRGGGLVTSGLRAIKADRVWYELGVTGQNALVANLDTGVDGNHPALASRWRGTHTPWQHAWKDVLGTGTTFPTDTGAHGTHVMGTITGLGAATGDSIGVAPGAEWIAANAINQGVGNAFDNDVIECFQWFSDPDGNPGTVEDVPDVVQNSWRINEGFGGSYTDCDTRWWASMDNLEAAGTVITFSAGNEGPGPMTIGSPPDRATTPLNAFSVGAIDGRGSFPFPIAGFSSRGPSGCPGNAIKPEIAAPGVEVYSSVPGGGYQSSGWSGTSMAGPHVAGVVGLMRSVAPDLEVDLIKQILLDTAVDHGAAGEDNSFGWGVIDAYAAVVQVASGLATLSGEVTNGSNGDTPIENATVTIVEIDRSFNTSADGTYFGFGPAGTYTVEASHPLFGTESVPGVILTEGENTVLDFSLTDQVGPDITDVNYPPFQDETLPVTALISDLSTIVNAEIVFRVDGGPWDSVPMTPGALADGGFYEGDIPGQAIGSLLEFYIQSEDSAGNIGTEPPNAPADVFSLVIAELFFLDDAEGNLGWSLSASGDAGAGRWVRVDPYGTTYQSNQVEPADDHTTNPGVICFVTGQGMQGGSAGISDVDFGCVTLTSPVIDLSGVTDASLTFWRWYAQFGPADASYTAYVSSNGGANWTSFETLNANANSWTKVERDLDSIITLTSQMRFRFIACDTGSETLVECAIDDFVIGGVPGTSSAPEGLASRTQLWPNRPNPFTGGTAIRFALSAASQVRVAVFDAQGRLVRSLLDEARPAGAHAVEWDGKDGQGREVPAGVYLYRMEANDFKAERKLLRVE